MLCIWWDQREVVYYELLKPNEIVTPKRYQQQLIDVNHPLNEERPMHANTQRKVVLLQFTTCSNQCNAFFKNSTAERNQKMARRMNRIRGQTIFFDGIHKLPE